MHPKKRQQNELIGFLVGLGMRVSEMTDFVDLGYQTIRRRIKSNGFIVRKKKRRYAATRITRNSKPYRLWRASVLARDGYKCQFCGSRERLEVDHIEPVSKRPDLIMVDSNARTLCKPCHQTTDSYPIILRTARLEMAIGA